MSFVLLDTGVLTAFVTLVALVTVTGVAVLLGATVHTVTRHRPVRLARQESVPAYYRGLVHAH